MNYLILVFSIPKLIKIIISKKIKSGSCTASIDNDDNKIKNLLKDKKYTYLAKVNKLNFAKANFFVTDFLISKA